jgi:hypothetical protein
MATKSQTPAVVTKSAWKYEVGAKVKTRDRVIHKIKQQAHIGGGDEIYFCVESSDGSEGRWIAGHLLQLVEG